MIRRASLISPCFSLLFGGASPSRPGRLCGDTTKVGRYLEPTTSLCLLRFYDSTVPTSTNLPTLSIFFSGILGEFAFFFFFSYFFYTWLFTKRMPNIHSVFFHFFFDIYYLALLLFTKILKVFGRLAGWSGRLLYEGKQ
ncbi:hypothetical protein DFH27DRAFT_179496 [Peziza echinospora]|nr:hypothetical protein DFH27DRAFT_179496 [Peziza echinospora]